MAANRGATNGPQRPSSQRVVSQNVSGYALLAKLRAQATTRSIPAVAVTANAMPGEADQAPTAVFAAFVTKPLNVARLDALLRERLGRRSAQHRGWIDDNVDRSP